LAVGGVDPHAGRGGFGRWVAVDHRVGCGAVGVGLSTVRARSAGGGAGAASSPGNVRPVVARWALRRGFAGRRILQAKGLIERARDYLEGSFLPGRAFVSPADFNTRLRAWLAVVNTRVRRALGCAPVDRIAADKAAMLTVAPVAPVTGWRSATRLARDHYLRLDSHDYSVHPSVIGCRVEIIGELARVRVFCEGTLVVDHDRLWARHQTISDPERVAAATAPRRERIGLVWPVREPEVETRCLADYDTALGLEDVEGARGGVA
jgi:hypothetical protein